MFRVPSTPDSRRGDDFDNPSTTPAGPPPTGYTAQSFTPAGRPPPSSIYGNSMAQPNANGPPAKSPFSFSAFIQSPAPAKAAPSNRVPSRGFTVPSSSPGAQDASLDYGGANFQTYQPESFSLSAFQAAGIDANDNILDFEEPRGAKRSRNGHIMSQSLRASQMFGPGFEGEARMPSIIEGLVPAMPAIQLTEDDDTIIGTEEILETLDKAIGRGSQQDVDQAVEHAVADLHQEWSQMELDTIPAGMGPASKVAFDKAAFIATLLFQIHNPVNDINDETSVQITRTPVPKALLDWLNKYHNPFPEDLSEVRTYRPSPTAHDRFWDTIFATLLRGQISTVIDLLSNADWSNAYTSIEDGYTTLGYKGAQLLAIQHAVSMCVKLLRSCPAVMDDDWLVTGPGWTLFRERAQRALDDLVEYAEPNNGDREYGDLNVFSASSRSFAAGSRRAESKVPWAVYEQLKAIYGQLLGLKGEIMLSAQDWLEATLYLTIWWDGNEELPLGASRRGYPTKRRDRAIDIDPLPVYRRKLFESFASVTDDPKEQSLEVNTVDAIQVALGAVFEDEVESVLKIIQRLSPVVAAAVVDVASAGGWMPSGRPGTADVMDGFDQDDLMVLSHGQLTKKSDLTRDSVLVTLAELLAQEPTLKPQGREEQSGWKIAVRILSRLDSASTAHAKIASVFNNMTLSSAAQVDEALSVCNSLGLSEQVREISEKYADSLTTNSQSYGQALLYYARAHSEKQLQTTLDLLLSTSLVRSAACPARHELDPQLADLLSNGTGVLTQLARVDNEAARLLADKSSGYATLRRFYELRDEDDEAEEENRRFRSGLKPLKRRKEMVKGLVALVESAGESIRGGLFDANIGGVVQVDTLLALLGEALPLLHEHGALFSKAQLVSLLRIVEDLQTVSSRIYDQAEAVFQASMADFNTKQSLAPKDLSKSLQLAKSGSDLAGSAFGMINSRGSIETEQSDAAMADSTVSGDRAWDWRRGMALTVGKGAKGSDMLRILRIAIAKETGRAWTEGR